MRQFIKTPPRTIMEVFQMLPEGTLAELINGSIYMSPVPSVSHQRILRELAFALSAFVKQNKMGEILFAPCDVYFDGHANAVQPDIIFISSGKGNIVKQQNVQGVPDMLIEILSLGNSDHDLVLKKDLYQRFGVKEYWIINPETKEATGFTLKEDKYIAISQFSGKISSSLLNSDFNF
jgi:Uma2 family endonuclease